MIILPLDRRMYYFKQIKNGDILSVEAENLVLRAEVKNG